MRTFGGLVEKAEEQLDKADPNWKADAAMLAGIGYAILALAKAVENVSLEMHKTRNHISG